MDDHRDIIELKEKIDLKINFENEQLREITKENYKILGGIVVLITSIGGYFQQNPEYLGKFLYLWLIAFFIVALAHTLWGIIHKYRESKSTKTNEWLDNIYKDEKLRANTNILTHYRMINRKPVGQAIAFLCASVVIITLLSFSNFIDIMNLNQGIGLWILFYSGWFVIGGFIAHRTSIYVNQMSKFVGSDDKLIGAPFPEKNTIYKKDSLKYGYYLYFITNILFASLVAYILLNLLNWDITSLNRSDLWTVIIILISQLIIIEIGDLYSSLPFAQGIVHEKIRWLNHLKTELFGLENLYDQQKVEIIMVKFNLTDVYQLVPIGSLAIFHKYRVIPNINQVIVDTCGDILVERLNFSQT